MNKKPKAPKPIMLYDHMPGILAIYPAVLFTMLAILSYPIQRVIPKEDAEQISQKLLELPGIKENSLSDFLSTHKSLIDPHLLFWIGLAVMIMWYIAYRFNLPKGKFFLVFGLMGTFVGIPIILEISGFIGVFAWMSKQLQGLQPTANTGGFVALALVFYIMFAVNFIYSRTHMVVKIDESGLTLNRLGGKGERFELIGLKTENEPLDYLELFMAGIGSLTLKTRMNKEIFSMKRVVGLYRIPWFPFFRGKLSAIEEILSYQGKVSISQQDAIDRAAQDEAENLNDDFGDMGDDNRK